MSTGSGGPLYRLLPVCCGSWWNMGQGEYGGRVVAEGVVVGTGVAVGAGQGVGTGVSAGEGDGVTDGGGTGEGIGLGEGAGDKTKVAAMLWLTVTWTKV